MAPDPTQMITFRYNSTRVMDHHPEVLTAICDAYSDACDWHKADGALIGKRAPNASVSTNLRNSKGVFKDGSVPGSRYFVPNGVGVQECCNLYVGWALPVSEVALQCDQDPKRDGLHMRTDNTFGALCAYAIQGTCGPGNCLYFELP
jgi:hypothetical protein